MLARTAQAPAWSKQAYVCRACRRQWQVSRQRRWNGHQTQVYGAATTADSWIDTMNDISDEYSSHKPSKYAKDDDPERPKKSSSSKPQRAKVEDSKRPKPGGISIKSLQETLDATIPAQALDESAGSRAMHKAKRAAFETAFLSGRSRHRDRRKPDNTATSAGAPAPGVVQANDDILADLLHGLKADATILAAQQDEGVDQPREEKEEQETIRREAAGPVPFPLFKGKYRSWTANNTDASAGRSTEAVASEVAVEAPVWKAKTSPAESGLGGPVVARVGSNKPKSLLDHHQGAAWGASAEQASRSSRKVTFNTLAKADGTSLKMGAKAPPSYQFGFVDRFKTLWRGPVKQTAPEEDQMPVSPESQWKSKAPDQAADMQGLLSRLVTQSQTENGTIRGTASDETGFKTSDPSDEGRQQAANLNTAREQHTIVQTVDTSPESFTQSESPADILTKLYGGRLQSSKGRATEPAELTSNQSPQKFRLTSSDGGPLSWRIRRVSSSGPPAIDTRPDAQVATMPSEPPSKEPRASGADGGSEGLAIHNTLSKQVQCRSESSDATEEVSMSDLSSGQGEMSAAQANGVDAAASADMPSAEVTGLSLAQAMKVGSMPPLDRADLSLGDVIREAPYVAQRKQRRAEAKAAREALRAKPVVTELALDNEVDSQEQAEEQSHVDVLSAQLSELEIEPVDIPQPPVPYLEYGLSRVLFNPGVYQLQDAVSRVYNFDPYLQKIMPVEQFDFNALKEYKTSSQDTALAAIAKQQARRYIGSTSSMTSSLAHFHYLISNWRPLNLDMLSHGYVGKGTKFDYTQINRAPSAIFLRWKDGSYAIDADKEFDSANVLMLLGKSMELLLTLPKDEYERYRKSDPRTVPEEQRTAPESYQYTTMGDFLMRSQLDAYDPRLPGNGTFDLKTRAVVTVRMSAHDHEKMTGYEIYGNHGRWGSYEKEYHDMARATMLKYMLQARMGRMNGIFVAYHNVKRIFGFQYISIADMDRVLHGQSDTCLGDQEFKASLRMMNDLLNKATAKYPEQSLRIHFETQSSSDKNVPTCLHMFAEPMSEQEIDKIQSKQKEKVAEYERRIMGKEDVPIAEASSAELQDQASNAEESSATPIESQDEASEYARQQLSFASTDLPADEPFLNEVRETQTGDVGPLFYATAIVQSEVNGSIANERVEKLKKKDEWTLNYLIKDYEVSRHHWALYDDMKARRREALYFGREDADEADGEADGKAEVEDKYIEFLQKMSRQGQAVREKQDLADLESGSHEVLVDEPLPQVREKVETLEQYIEWMYRKERE